MLNRRSLLISGATAAMAALLPHRSQDSRADGLNRPAPLRRGSRLRALNPGTWMDPEMDFAPLIERCAAEGWMLEIPDTVRRQWRYFSGTDQQRVAELNAAWNDPTLDGLLYVGGGWGGARVLEAGFRFPQRALWSVGFSDSSSLLLAQCAAGLPGAIHGSCGGPDERWQRTVALLRGQPVAPLQGVGRRSGRARGPLVVTNLTVATHLIGTPWMPDLRGAILVGRRWEAPYRVDRMLTSGAAPGCFKNSPAWLAGGSAGGRTTSFPVTSRWRRSLRSDWGIWACRWSSIYPWAMDCPTWRCPWEWTRRSTGGRATSA